MKYTRSLIATVAIVASTVTASGVIAATHTSAPIPEVKKVATTETMKPQETPLVAQAPTDNTPATPATVQPSPVAPVSTTPADNKAKLETLITATATDRGIDPQTQWICLDRIITANIGYANYNDVIDATKSPVVYRFLNGIDTGTGFRTYVKFDGPGTCSQILYQVAN